MACSTFAIISLPCCLAYQTEAATRTKLRISLPLICFKKQELRSYATHETSMVKNHCVPVDLAVDCSHENSHWMQCRHLGGQNDSFLSNCRNFPSIISGFWMGPDAEDGWGFVEAFVDHYFE